MSAWNIYQDLQAWALDLWIIDTNRVKASKLWRLANKYKRIHEERHLIDRDKFWEMGKR